MVGFLSRLVQRTLAESSTILPRLSGPYEDSRVSAATRAGDGSDEAMAALRLARDQTGQRVESAAPTESGLREASATAGRGNTANADRRLPDALMPIRTEDPVSVDRHDVPYDSLADIAAAATPPSGVRQHRSAFPGSEASTALRQRADVQSLESVEPYQSPTPSGLSQSHARMPPMWSPAVHNGDPMTSQNGVRTLLDEGDSQNDSLELFGKPRFEPTGRRSGPVAESEASQSSIVPSIDPLPTIRTVQPAQGMLVEPPATQPSAMRNTASDVQLHTSLQLSAMPTVHVTIGRIELRAAPSAAAPAPSSPTENRPSLSLADYLEHRATAGPR